MIKYPNSSYSITSNAKYLQKVTREKRKIQVSIQQSDKKRSIRLFEHFTVARSHVERPIKTRNSRNLIARYWPANGHVIVENMYAANRYCSTVKDNLDRAKSRKRSARRGGIAKKHRTSPRGPTPNVAIETNLMDAFNIDLWRRLCRSIRRLNIPRWLNWDIRFFHWFSIVRISNWSCLFICLFDRGLKFSKV